MNEQPVTSREAVTLREYFEAALNHERELRETNDIANAKALSLQAGEYGRRLDDLNHAHEHAVEQQATFMPRELFEAYVKESSRAREVLASALATETAGLSTRIGALAQRVSNIEGRIAVYAAGAAILASAIVGIAFKAFE